MLNCGRERVESRERKVIIGLDLAQRLGLCNKKKRADSPIPLRQVETKLGDTTPKKSTKITKNTQFNGAN